MSNKGLRCNKILPNYILRYSSLFLFSILISAPSFSQEVVPNLKPINSPVQSTNNIIIETNPQTFKTTIPTPINDYINEIDKKNQILKKDLILLRSQVNDLSKEISNVKTERSDSFIQDIIEKQTNVIIVIFSILVLLLVIFLYLVYRKIKNENAKLVYMKLSELTEQTKKDILRDFKIKEAEYEVNALVISEIKQNEFENKLNNKYINYIKDIAQNNEIEISKFQTSLDDNVKINTKIFENELENVFEKKNNEFKEKIEFIFPTDSTNSIVKKVLEDQNVIKSVSENIENNVINSIKEKIKQLEDNIHNKEKEVINDIQKVQLSTNHFNIANILLRDGKLEESIDEFHLSLRTDPNFYGAYINLGKAYEMIKNTDNAIDMYNQAVSIRPEYYKAYFNLANLLMTIKKYDDADFMYKKALDYSPDNHKIYNNLGIVSQLNLKNESARGYYLKAIAIKKDYPDAYINLAKLETQMGNDRGLYQIAEVYMKKNNASEQTYYKVKEMAYKSID